jgi:uncharacterized membrane protein YcaP (DUF421 family)
VEPHRIAVRAVFAYVVLLALLRASGKRTVAQGTAFDFVLALVLGDMVDDLVWAEVSAARFTVGAGMLTLAHTFVSVAAGLSERFDRLIAGTPAVALANGSPRRDALRAERMNLHELGRMLRQEGVPDEGWRDVRRVYVEVSGRAAVLREPWAEAPQRKDAARIERKRR